ncbi:uncharacterized protein C8orf76 homolog isoform X2 [Pseudochaenichthys georgianus]|uniref:uncharacterized protein C8orf76 homolog isoform X2 n=1 Tax=Pseudochaenichthys georgianus TaxID=52239 RepID=UPI00146DD2D8|nr:zinc fingers and homeoboxes protein 1 isoform X2 [Pseudochaenichthys georgianus]
MIYLRLPDFKKQQQWFCESSALCTDDPLEKQKVYKFRGDLALKQGNYQKALDVYSSCLELNSANNMTIRRDVLEGMARCCTELGQRDRALHLSDLLSKDASNTCHLISILLLKVRIYQHFGALASRMSCLQQLCILLPFNPWHWFNLGQMCLELLDSNSPSGSCSLQSCEPAEKTQSDGDIQEQQQEEEEEEEQQEEEEEQEEEEAELDGDRVWLKACTCFIRTRLLLRFLRQQQSSFVLQRTESTLQTTDEVLQRLNPKETTLQTLTEVVSEDLIPDKMREDSQDGESLSSVCLQSFKERWWNKILLTGVLETDAHREVRPVR